MKNVLVTGGTGLLGNNIVRSLVDQGFQVRAAVRPSSNRIPLAELPIEIVEVDFADENSIAIALEGIDTAIHSAGFIWFGWTKIEQSRRANVDTTRQLANACASRGVRFVHVSSLDALPVGRKGQVLDEDAIKEPEKWGKKPPCNYVVSKLEADAVVDELFAQGLDGCIVHPGLMFGRYDWKPSSGELIQAISKTGWLFSSPTGGISVTHVKDVANATIRAAEIGETAGRYILAGHNMPYREVCHRIADKCNVARARGRTGPVAMGVAWVVGNFSTLFGNESQVNTAAVRMARLWHYYSSEKAMKELDYQISDLDKIIDDAVEWLIEQNMIPDRRKK